MMIAEDGVLNGVVVTNVEKDVGEFAFAVLLGTGKVEIAELGVSLGTTVVTLKRDVDDSYYSWTTIGFEKNWNCPVEKFGAPN